MKGDVGVMSMEDEFGTVKSGEASWAVLTKMPQLENQMFDTGHRIQSGWKGFWSGEKVTLMSARPHSPALLRWRSGSVSDG
jgi:hypothetical protein